MVELEGKVVVITGAASGIGLATARRFARLGARLHLVDIDEPGLEDAKWEVEQRGLRATSHLVDCREAEAVERLAEAVYDEPEARVDVLHNNAGVCCGGAVEEMSLDDWHWTMGINFWGVLHGIHAFLPKMIAQGGGGHIINTASMAGLVGLPMVAPYCASKFAVVGLSESLDLELAPHDIRVTAVCPGSARTKVMESGRFQLPGDLGERFVDAMARWAPEPDRVARRVVDAVRRDRRSVVPTGADMVPLYWLRQLSPRLYRAMFRSISVAASRR